MKFGWDDTKATTNFVKHKVSFDEATTVFGDTFSISGRDIEHSLTELRCIIIGFSNEGRTLVVSYTDRNSIIRIISARPATRKEKKLYEEG